MCQAWFGSHEDEDDHADGIAEHPDTEVLDEVSILDELKRCLDGGAGDLTLIEQMVRLYIEGDEPGNSASDGNLVELLLSDDAAVSFSGQVLSECLDLVWEHDLQIFHGQLQAGVRDYDIDSFNWILVAYHDLCFPLISWLVKHGFDVNQCDSHGYTPLMFAREQCNGTCLLNVPVTCPCQKQGMVQLVKLLQDHTHQCEPRLTRDLRSLNSTTIAAARCFNATC